MSERVKAKRCIGCGSESARMLIDLGQQPASNYFLLNPTDACASHPLEFGACSVCGLGQLFNPIAPDVVRSRFEWLTYNEPEGHLDDLVEKLSEMMVDSRNLQIHGVTYKDESTLERFQRKGGANTYLLKQHDDLGIKDHLASLETIQQVLSPDLANELVTKLGKADVLLVRHILEHAHEPRMFLEACEKLCRPEGVMVFEVPDCRKILGGHDHCFLWEEHISYFTPETLKVFFQNSGFADVEIKVYPYPMEDSLIAIVRNVKGGGTKTDINVESELKRIESFSSSFSSRTEGVKQYLKGLQDEGQRVALFGAGHLAAKFINFYDLADHLIGVIDDNPNKCGRYMPGSGLPIISSQCLENGEVDLCLLTLNPESEQKVRTSKATYLEKGGEFRSIFSASASSIDQVVSYDRT